MPPRVGPLAQTIAYQRGSVGIDPRLETGELI